MSRPLPLLAILGSLAACGRAGRGTGEPFGLVAFREAGAPAVLLNEVLLFTFSAPVDPSSVTSRSIAIRSEEGSPAHGRFEVRRNRVEFHPDRVLARALDDGGYRPATAYRVEVAGFPRPDGLRSRDGRVLERGARFSFRAVDPAAGIQPFLDETPLKGPFPYLPDSPRTLQVRIGDPISILFTEPLRPDTVTEEAFRLREFRGGSDASEVPMTVRLGRRETARFDDREGGDLVEILPREPKPPPASYVLEVRDRIQDYGGNRVPPLSTLVEFLPSSPEEAVSVFSEEFLSTRNLDLEDPGEDGWAAWTGDGRVSVQVPAAAGDGRLGAWSPAGLVPWRAGEAARISVEGDEIEARVADLPFARVDLPPEADLRIEEDGPVWIRSASTFTVRGAIRRGRTRGGVPTLRKRGSPSDLEDALPLLEDPRGPDLVLVSAGNLVVEGEVACEGILVLVTGGRLVVPAGGKVTAGRLFLASPGPPLVRGLIHPELEGLRPAPPGEGWRPPRPLAFSCASRFLPFPAARYLSPAILEGGGGVEVLFYGARALPDRSAEPDPSTVAGPFEDPERLEGLPFLRFRVRFEVRPEAPQASAFLDALRVRMRRGSEPR
ncbi:MAG TPA: hypothetical protein VFI25_04715 [Planctomycetota bacterium]|nr:hypothetical protein [Planctomycetota bacterium]